MRVKDIAMALEQLAPAELAQEWDNVGLLFGDKEKEVKKLMVSLDLNEQVLGQAVEKGAEMVVTHHPLIFKPVSSITSPLLLKVAQAQIPVYSAHTNLDAADGGVNDALAQQLGLRNVQAQGMLRYGDIPELPLADFAGFVKEKLKTCGVRVAGNLQAAVSKVGVLGGAGGDFAGEAKKAGCDVFVTGEASYHEAQYADELGIALIAAGHFETENIVVEKLVFQLSQMLKGVEVIPSAQTNQYRII